MSEVQYNANRVVLYIEASSKDKLIDLMRITNELNHVNYNYQTPMKDGNKWVVWYYGTIGKDIQVKEKDLRRTITAMGMLDEHNA